MELLVVVCLMFFFLDPDKITKLAATNRNDSTITITWSPPYRPRGKLDYYVVSIEKIFDRENRTSEYNVTSQFK